MNTDVFLMVLLFSMVLIGLYLASEMLVDEDEDEDEEHELFLLITNYQKICLDHNVKPIKTKNVEVIKEHIQFIIKHGK